MKEEIHNIRGLYVHVPFCDGKCGYCAFYSILYGRRRADRYLKALEQELARPGLKPETIYIGGGTPSVLSVRQLKRLCAAIRRHVSFDRVTEWTVEVNPGSISRDKLSILVAAGVNRISLGAQSFDNDALRWLGRRHLADDTVRSVEVVRASGIKNLNLDLIACVPGLGGRVWENTVRQAIALGPEHVSVYALTQEEGTRLSRAAPKGKIVMLTDDEQLEALDIAERLLTNAGYCRYEISNYAKPGFECRHHLSCWRGGEYLGLGPAAASHVGLERKTNLPDIAGYLEALERGGTPPCDSETLTPELKTTERLIFGLRMTEGVEAELGAGRRQTLDALQRDGLVIFDKKRWALTPVGCNLADYVGVELIGNEREWEKNDRDAEKSF